jgi:glycosyltransferase involved in cell wall biosynthesis
MPNLNPYLSVVIPCYNEAKNIERGALEEVYQYLVAQEYPWQVIIVNDESTDNSRDFIERFIRGKLNFSLFDIPHGGKPAAVWAGIQKAAGEVVLLTDMDQSTPIRELDKLLPSYEQGFDTVIGSRGAAREGFSLVRKLGSFVFRNLRGILMLRGISDTQCGFKLFRRRVLLSIFPFLEFLRRKNKSVGWKVTAYDVELLYLIEKAGYRIKEVTVDWYNRDQSDTKSRIKGELPRYLRESVEMGQEILRVKINQWQGLYDGVGKARMVNDK